MALDALRGKTALLQPLEPWAQTFAVAQSRNKYILRLGDIARSYTLPLQAPSIRYSRAFCQPAHFPISPQAGFLRV